MAITVCILSALCLNISLAACNDSENKESGNTNIENPSTENTTVSNNDETFAGVVSDEVYRNETYALEAFVEAELSTEAFSTEYSGSLTKKINDLTESEISGLNLGSLENINSVSKWEVAYSYVQRSTDGASTSSHRLTAKKATDYKTVADENDGLNYVTAYLVDSGGGEIRYYVALPEVGEHITKSYYDSVFDSSNYVNSTLTYGTQGEIKINGEQATDERALASLEMISSLKVKVYNTENLIMSSLSYRMAGSSYGDDVYIANTAQGWKAIELTSCDDEFTYNEPDISELNHNFDPDNPSAWCSTYLANADMAYYIKTENGFKVDPSYKEAIIYASDNIYSTSYSQMYERGLIDINGGTLEYIVSEGKLIQEKVTVDISYTANDDPYNVIEERTCTFSDFGTTSITVPDDIKAMLGF